MVLGFGIGVYVLWRIQEVIFLLFVAILVAILVDDRALSRLRSGSRGGVEVSPGTAVLVIVYALVIQHIETNVLVPRVQVVLAHTLRAEDPAQAEEHADPQERLEQQVGAHGPAADAVAANP